jgi:hypothetical protein
MSGKQDLSGELLLAAHWVVVALLPAVPVWLVPDLLHHWPIYWLWGPGFGIFVVYGSALEDVPDSNPPRSRVNLLRGLLMPECTSRL